MVRHKCERLTAALYEGEENTLPSCTIPDDSLTIKDILYRFTKGMPLDLPYRAAMYDDADDDEVHPSNMRNLDLVDMLEMSENASKTINDYKTSSNTSNVTTTNDDATSSNTLSE